MEGINIETTESRISKVEERILQLEQAFQKQQENLLFETTDSNDTADDFDSSSYKSSFLLESFESMSGLQTKIDYLTAVNDQMFHQNRRIREYIERCLKNEDTLNQDRYYQTLKGD